MVNILSGTIRVKHVAGEFAIIVVNDKYPSMSTMLATASSQVAADGIASAFKTMKAAIHAYQMVDIAIKTKGVKDEI